MMMGLLVVKERAFQPYFNGDVSVELTLSNSHCRTHTVILSWVRSVNERA